MTKVTDYFGSMVFDDRVMKATLSAKVYASLKKTIDEGTELDIGVANAVASAMKDWAIAKGATHYTHKEKRKKIAENEELNLLINALGLEEDIDDLRYNKIIVATDADNDGMHIRMLVCTFFMKYHPDLIRRGHLYILETPLFRVKNKNEVRYCYSIEEKDKVVNQMKGKVEITRFKGLGEISWEEFTGFIGKDIRLNKVRLGEEEPLSDILEFYMGENTIDRQLFISRNLRSARELGDIDF